MARDVDLPSNKKGASGQRPPGGGVIAFDTGRRTSNLVRPINLAKTTSGVSWPGLWRRSLAGTGPLILLAIAALTAFYPSLKDKKPTVVGLKSDDRPRTSPADQPSSPAQRLTSPTPAVATRLYGRAMPVHTAQAISNPPGLPVARYRSMKYEATHKKAFGGCAGQLELTKVSLQFKCANQTDLDIPVASIAEAHKDGVVLASGEKYHFLIANHTKGQAEAVFTNWLNQVRQPGSESSF